METLQEYRSNEKETWKADHNVLDSGEYVIVDDQRFGEKQGRIQTVYAKVLRQLVLDYYHAYFPAVGNFLQISLDDMFVWNMENCLQD